MSNILGLILVGSVLLIGYLISVFGVGVIIGLIIGFIAANIIFYSNNPIIVQGLRIITGNRPSMIKTMLEEDVKNEKRFKVKYSRS